MPPPQGHVHPIAHNSTLGMIAIGAAGCGRARPVGTAHADKKQAGPNKKVPDSREPGSWKFKSLATLSA